MSTAAGQNVSSDTTLSNEQRKLRPNQSLLVFIYDALSSSGHVPPYLSILLLYNNFSSSSFVFLQLQSIPKALVHLNSLALICEGHTSKLSIA